MMTSSSDSKEQSDPRTLGNERKRLAVDEIMDIPGLSKIRNILEKYQLSSVTIDFKLQIVARDSRNYNPRNKP